MRSPLLPDGIASIIRNVERSADTGRGLGDQFEVHPIAQDEAGDRFGLQGVRHIDQARVRDGGAAGYDRPDLPDCDPRMHAKALRVALPFLDRKPLRHVLFLLPVAL